MKFCIVLSNGQEVIVAAEAVDNLAEFAAIAMKDGYVVGRMANDEPLLVPWHAMIGVREAQEERLA